MICNKILLRKEWAMMSQDELVGKASPYKDKAQLDEIFS